MMNKEDIISDMGNFLYDFAYTKVDGQDAFEQGFPEGKKYVIFNISPYSSGLMIEILLGLQFYKVEEILHQFSERFFSEGDLSLTFRTGLLSLSDRLPDRIFVSTKREAVDTIADFEQHLVKKGFYWLDEFSALTAMAKKLHEAIAQGDFKNRNPFYLCQRSLILQRQLGKPLTDELFYNYFEALQSQKVPDSLIEDFFHFRRYLQRLDL